MNKIQIVKSRCLTLKKELSEADAVDIKSKLGQFSLGIIETKIDQSKIYIRYDLQQTCYQKIKTFLNDITDLEDKNIFSQGLCRLICYCEVNELDHANHKTNWQYYIRNLYLSLHKEIIE